MIGIIGTWKMAARGVSAANALLRSGANGADAVARAITDVEDDPAFTSVGYGGLPDQDGHVMTDAAFMDGQNLRLGAVMAAENVRNPILLARHLCGRKTDCVLAGRGAELAAIQAGLPMRDLRTAASLARWREENACQQDTQDAYRGHDTVCVLAVDAQGRMFAGTSTSGLFLKKPGRVGDSPLVGSGFYCDARFGAAAATGLGEDIMRGCLSYEIVSLMRGGASPSEACGTALRFLTERKIELGEDAGSISLIALSPDGRFGAATTLLRFPFAAGGEEGVSLYVSESGKAGYRPAGEREIENDP